MHPGQNDSLVSRKQGCFRSIANEPNMIIWPLDPGKKGVLCFKGNDVRRVFQIVGKETKTDTC